MITKTRISFVLVIGLLLIVASVFPRLSTIASASSVGQENTTEGMTIPYTGQLNTVEGQSAPEGFYSFAFCLYGSETGADQLWSEVQDGVGVMGGLFTTSLGKVNPIPTAVLNGKDLWLSIQVRGPGDAEFTGLTPRQRVSPDLPAMPNSAMDGGACPHDHLGETWDWGSNTSTGFTLIGNVPWSNALLKVNNSNNGPSVWGVNSGGGNAIRGNNYGSGIGVYGEGESNQGVVGRSSSGFGVEGTSDSGSGGVWAHSVNGYGLFTHSDNNSAIYVDGAGSYGVHVGSAGDHGVYVESAGWDGVAVWSAAVVGVWVNSAGQDGVLVSTAGWDGVHVVGPVGGVYYGSGKQGDEDFAVLNTGEVRSKVGFATPANDFSVMMNVQGEKSDYQPGEVLIISSGEGASAEHCISAYSPTVIGVYTAAPGYLGGQTVTGKAESDSRIPVAIMGIVSVKVSAENGPIQPGDLLVTSSTPGYAMRGDNPPPGTILGKALAPLESGTGIILVLLMLQ